MAKRKKKFDPAAQVHRRLEFDFHGLRLIGRVTAAGYRTPTIVCQGNRTPVPFITIAPDGTVDSTSTQPSNTVDIDLGSTTAKTIRWLHAEDRDNDGDRRTAAG